MPREIIVNLKDAKRVEQILTDYKQTIVSVSTVNVKDTCIRITFVPTSFFE